MLRNTDSNIYTPSLAINTYKHGSSRGKITSMINGKEEVLYGVDQLLWEGS